MQATPRVFATLDLGAATVAAALIGRVDRRWRLLGALSAPATTPPERLLEVLAARIPSADPDLADAVGLVPEAAADLPTLVARSARPRTLAVLAASERALGALAGIVARSGWRWTGMSADRHDARAMTALLLDPVVVAVLVAVGDPPGGDERGALGLLGSLTAAAASRRPDLTIVLAGAVARSRGRFAAGGGSTAAASRLEDDNARGTAAGAAGEPDPAVDAESAQIQAAPDRGPSEPIDEPDETWRGTEVPAGRLLIGPTAAPGAPAWSGLTDLLAGLRRDEMDSRQAIGRSMSGLAGALDRRIELIEVGMDGGLRATAAPAGVAGGGTGLGVVVADAALVPADLDDARLERILDWSSLALDRHRLRDRLIELRSSPWAGVGGDGGRLRLAAARAAMARLLELTPDLDAVRPDLVVIAGGAFAPSAGAAVLLAVADVRRWPGAYQVAFDHARLLGPLGTIEDPAERDRLVADLAGDLLVPLGSVVMPAGLRAGRRPGTLVVAGPHGRADRPLVPGTLERLDLPPGTRASVVLEANDGVRLGSVGRRMSVEVAGGVGGLLVDLRGVPLPLPERREARRELLVRWQEAAWPGSAG